MSARPEPISEQEEPRALSRSVSKSKPSGVSMDVLSLIRLLARNWRVTVPAGLLTLIGLVASLQFASPSYQATGSIVLLSPPEAPDVNAVPQPAPTVTGQNPFARYDDLSIVADILARVMDSDSRRAEFERSGVTDYKVVANGLQRGPVIEVTGEGSSPDAAMGSAALLLANVDTVLVELQQAEGADPDYFITSAPLEPPSTATAVYGSTVRTAIAALVVGALGTLGLALLAEALAQRRRTRRTTSASTVIAEAASVTTERGDSDGSTNGDRVSGRSGAPPDLRLARREASQSRSARETTTDRRS